MRGLTSWPCVRGNIYEGLQADKKGQLYFRTLMIVITSICLILLLSVAGLLSYEILSASEKEGGSKNDHKQLEPWVRDPNLKVEGLQSPASFAFLA